MGWPAAPWPSTTSPLRSSACRQALAVASADCGSCAASAGDAVEDAKAGPVGEMTLHGEAAPVMVDHPHAGALHRTWFDVMFEMAVAALMALLVVTVLISTVSRYVFNASVIWSEEIPILLQV